MKKTVGIIYGGRSVEHEISIRSATNVAANLDNVRFDIVLIGITKSGNWYHTERVSEHIEAGDPLMIHLSTDNPAFIKSDGNELQIDLIFPVLHGTDGEDGSIQGLFKVINLPVVGSGVLGSATAMDKIASKKILEQSGVPVAPYMSFVREDEISFETVTSTLGLPLMIKSGNQGSSVGISKVSSEPEFGSALKTSFRYSNQILIESFVEGQELECAIIGNAHPSSTVPGEIILRKEYDFYTYEAKYQDDDAIDIKIPADLDEDTTASIRHNCEKAFIALGCNDYARVDVFITKDSQVIINEINTIPGFTSVSMFPMLWAEMGLDYKSLLTRLIQTCLDRFAADQNLETSYDNA